MGVALSCGQSAGSCHQETELRVDGQTSLARARGTDMFLLSISSLLLIKAPGNCLT